MEFTKDGSVDLRSQPIIASRTGRWKACSFLQGYEAFKRMAFYGVASNLVVYLTTQMRQEMVTSVHNVNNWTGAVWMTPIVGAYVADAFLSCFRTFTVASLIYLVVSKSSQKIISSPVESRKFVYRTNMVIGHGYDKLGRLLEATAPALHGGQ